ncbi:MAG: hypothetical protein ACLP9L_02555 [Thermoguttaceae bacterium]
MDAEEFVRFPTTLWGLVYAAQDRESGEWKDAMNRCITAYWKPVYAFIRAKGFPVHRAEELTQDFLLSFFLRDTFFSALRTR